jgi:dienelactone hydrolase
MATALSASSSAGEPARGRTEGVDDQVVEMGYALYRAYAVAQPALNAAVVYYAMSPETAALGAVRAPVLGLYGADDARVNASIGPAEAEMKKRLSKGYEPHVYDGAGHGFLRQQYGRDGAT